MATQGIVTLTDAGGRVLAKAVAGCNGQTAGALSVSARGLSAESGPRDLADGLYALAEATHFGCDACLVVQWDGGFIASQDAMDGSLEDLDVEGRWKDNFQAAKFNPRWARGTADYVRVVRLV